VACYLAAAAIGGTVAAVLAPQSGRDPAILVGCLAGIVLTRLAAIVAADRLRRRHPTSARKVDDVYYANLAAFVYGRGRNTRKLVIVLVAVIVVGLAVDLMATFV